MKAAKFFAPKKLVFTILEKASIKKGQSYPSIQGNLYTLYKILPKLAHQTGWWEFTIL